MSTRRPDLPRPATFSRGAPMSGAFDSTNPPPMRTPNPSGKSPDPFLMRIVVMVDDATEPNVTEAAAQRHRKKLMNIVLERDQSLPQPLTNITGGQAVAFALRKRLKSDDERAVINTLTLLDELMRTVPYFYRYIANEKFFRRLWRFVVPDYKNGVKSMIPIFGKPKVHLGMLANQSIVSERVRILIRAWAEELSVMFNGRYDPTAGFLIERYHNKKTRINFPEVPKTPTPWVCPVSNPDFLRRRGAAGSSSSRDPVENMTLAEVENTVSLFANLVENASSVADLREDACAELARRCKRIHENIAKMSTNMSKEEELNRAIVVSEMLQKSLVTYRSSLQNGHIVSSIPTIDSISLHSDDDGYERPAGRVTTRTRSLDRFENEPPPPQTRYDDSSDFSSGGRDEWRSRDRTREQDREREAELERANRERELDRENRDREIERANRERERETERERERERAHEKEKERERSRDKDREREREKDRDREKEDRDRDRERGRDKARDGRARSIDDREKYSSRSGTRDVDIIAGKQRMSSTEKRSRKPPAKPPMKRREKSDSDLPTLSRNKPSKKEGLIDVPAVDESSGDEDGEIGGDSFAMLAERYSSTKPSRKTKTRSSSKSKAPKQTAKTSPPTNDAAPAPSTTQAMPGPAMMNSNPAAMYQSVPGMGYNPMMVPNMYAMYGSVSHVPVQDPLGMMNAYQTVNPAMYYQTVNPQLYSMPTLPSAPSMPGLQGLPQEQSKQLQQPQQPQQPHLATSQPQPTPPLIPVSQAPQQQPSIGNVAPTHVSTPGSQQMVSMPHPASLYGSISGMNTGMVPGFQPGMQSGMQQGMQQSMPLTTMGSNVPGMPAMPGVVNGGMLQQAPSSSQDGAQAAAYQTAMHQAAVAFNAAATMYRSVSGQQPIVSQAAPTMQPGMMPLQQGVSIQQAPVGTAQDEEEQR